MRLLRYAKTLSRYWRMTKDPRTPPIVRYLIYGGLLYTLSPIDLLPDWVPLLGLLDDAAVLPSVITLSMLLIPKDVKRSHNQADAKELIRNKAEGQAKAREAEQQRYMS